VPVAAARLADVGVRDACEAVAGGVEQHLLASTAGLLLAPAARVELLPPGCGLARKRVPRALEGGEAQEASATPGGVERRGEGGGEGSELLVEPGDLVAQRAPRRGLVRRRRRQQVPVDGDGHLTLRSVRSG
jgi:hypothetical protein